MTNRTKNTHNNTNNFLSKRKATKLNRNEEIMLNSTVRKALDPQRKTRVYSTTTKKKPPSIPARVRVT